MILIGECIYTRISLTDGKRKDVSHLRKHLFGTIAKFNSQELEFLGMNKLYGSLCGHHLYGPKQTGSVPMTQQVIDIGMHIIHT